MQKEKYFLKKIKKIIQTQQDNQVTNSRYINQDFSKKINYKEHKKIRTPQKSNQPKKQKMQKIKFRLKKQKAKNTK